jgi:hypothetical protein
MNPIYTLITIYLIPIHLCLRFPSGLFPSDFPTNILYAFVYIPCFQLVSSSFIWPPSYYLERFNHTCKLNWGEVCYVLWGQDRPSYVCVCVGRAGGGGQMGPRVPPCSCLSVRNSKGQSEEGVLGVTMPWFRFSLIQFICIRIPLTRFALNTPS